MTFFRPSVFTLCAFAPCRIYVMVICANSPFDPYDITQDDNLYTIQPESIHLVNFIRQMCPDLVQTHSEKIWLTRKATLSSVWNNRADKAEKTFAD